MTRALELAEESGSIVARAQALHSAGTFHLERNEPERAVPLLEESRTLFAETGDAWMLGRTLNAPRVGRAAAERPGSRGALAPRCDPAAEAAGGPRRAV